MTNSNGIKMEFCLRSCKKIVSKCKLMECMNKYKNLHQYFLVHLRSRKDSYLFCQLHCHKLEEILRKSFNGACASIDKVHYRPRIWGGCQIVCCAKTSIWPENFTSGSIHDWNLHQSEWSECLVLIRGSFEYHAKRSTWILHKEGSMNILQKDWLECQAKKATWMLCKRISWIY